MHQDFTPEAMSAFFSTLGRALSELDRIPVEDRTSRWILDRTIDELGLLQRSGDLGPADIAAFRELRLILDLNVRRWSSHLESGS